MSIKLKTVRLISRRVVLVAGIVFLLAGNCLRAQNKSLVQIKTYDQELKPMGNLELSVNEKPFVAVNSRGVAFIELADNELPVKSVTLRNEQLEAASWNHSKGIVEIIVRKKSYQVIALFVRDPAGRPITGVEVIFNGKKPVRATTEASGKFEILLALDEKITHADQFRVGNYRILQLVLSEKENVLSVEPIQSAPVAKAEQEERTEPKPGYFSDFDLSKIDSIQSLTAFYAIFKNYSVSDLNPDVKRKLDEKLNQLVLQLKDSIANQGSAFVGRISDSSFVTDDIRNLIEQAEVENRVLDEQREEVYEKIRLINEKIAAAGDNLDEAARTVLLSDLTRLDQLLQENENRFYKNQNDYRSILNAIKDKFFHIGLLETKLSESETQRLEEQELFRKRLLTIVSIASVFALLVLLLVWLSVKLRKRKKQLEVANGEVRRINENLETLVNERTRLLIETNRELDLFLYKASHDLRSPVTSIIGLCNIATHFANGESKELFEKTGKTALSMDKLLKKLRIISEVNQPGNFSSIDLLPMVEGLKNKFSNFIAEHHINFAIDCPADLSIYSNATLTEAILSALLENAVLYSTLGEGPPKVELTARLENDTLRFSIFDNGMGIDESIRNNIFDMFFIGNEHSKGNGLGLYIVEKSVHALKGTIELETETNKFSRFMVSIPINSTLAGREPQVHALPERRIFAEASTWV